MAGLRSAEPSERAESRPLSARRLPVATLVRYPPDPAVRAAAAILAAWLLGMPHAVANEPTPVGLSLLAPGDRGLRADLAWLVDRRVLSLPLGTWPLPSSTLQAASSGVDSRTLDPADADALARLQRAVRRGTDTARMSAHVNTARHPSLDGGEAARGTASGALSFYAGSEQWGGQLSLGVTADSLAANDPRGNLDGSYLAVLFSGTLVAAGVTDRWWGPGQFTSPILSTAARPIAGLTVRRADDSAAESPWLQWIGRWGYEFSAGGLAHYDPDGARTLGLRLYTRPWPNVEIGVSRSILWGGTNRPDRWSALRNALLGQSNVDDPASQGEDPSDEISGLDLRVSAADAWGGSWIGYLHLVGEDEAGNLPTKLFGTVGAQVKGLWANQRFDASLETTNTIPSNVYGNGAQFPAYNHHIYVDGYYQGRLPIGANIGGGGRIGTLGLGWTPVDHPSQLRVFGTAYLGRVSALGPQPVNARYGTPGRLGGLSLAVEGESAARLRWQLGLSVQHYSGVDRRQTGLLASIEVPVDPGR
jgi:Capsule assembly protein Wzi